MITYVLKALRIYVLTGLYAKKLKKGTFSNGQLAQYIGIVLLLTSIYILVWALVDPAQVSLIKGLTEQVQVGENSENLKMTIQTVFNVCTHKSNMWALLIGAVEAILFLATMYLAWVNRKQSDVLSETLGMVQIFI
jgi:hypothetical protein